MSYDEKAYQKKYRQDNKERIAEVKRLWRERNKDRCNLRDKEYREKNKETLYKSNLEWRKNNPDKMAIHYRKRNLKIKYGMSLEDYDNLLAKQNHVCAICEQKETIPNRPLSVDHCHDTGKVRGLLCNDCNRNLIAQRNDAEIFYRAAKYITRYK